MTTEAASAGSPAALTRAFEIVGVPVAVSSSLPIVIDIVEKTYTAFSAPRASQPNPYSIEVGERDGAIVIGDSDGGSASAETGPEATIAVLNLIVQRVVGELAVRGLHAVHAASLATSQGGVIISGRSGAGKTTLALGLLTRGLRILSDEFAVVGPEAESVLPYRRSLHIRPGTPELVPQLAFLLERPRDQLGGGSEWSLSPAELDEVFPGCLGGPVAPMHVLLVEPRREGAASRLEPLASGVAAVELTRAAAAAATDFATVLARMSLLAGKTRCARLHPGSLESSLDLIIDWLGEPPTAG
jgi:hypothetical protein